MKHGLPRLRLAVTNERNKKITRHCERSNLESVCVKHGLPRLRLFMLKKKNKILNSEFLIHN